MNADFGSALLSSEAMKNLEKMNECSIVLRKDERMLNRIKKRRMNAQISGFYYLTSDGTSWLPLGAISWNQNILACFFLGGNVARLKTTEKTVSFASRHFTVNLGTSNKTIFLLFLRRRFIKWYEKFVLKFVGGKIISIFLLCWWFFKHYFKCIGYKQPSVPEFIDPVFAETSANKPLVFND
jgi:hypothetical protein